jgi:DNA-binding transcriptional LysR family regulator
MALKVEMLRCFCAVAKAGNLSDAADRLGRTQSAVSMTLKQLEQHLGGALFESERKNRLTALGKQVFQLGEAQLKHFDSTVDAIEQLALAPQGVLRIAAVPSVAALAFPPVIRHTTQHYPGLKVELRDADTQQVIDSLVQGWADIGIASAQHSLNGISVTQLFSDPFGLVLLDSHPLARRSAPIQITDVFAGPFLRNALCDQLQTPQIQKHLNQVDVSVYNTQSLLAMVREGDWATLLPYSTLRLAPSRLAFRPVAGLEETRQVFLYTRDKPSAPEALRDVAKVIQGLGWPAPGAAPGTG